MRKSFLEYLTDAEKTYNFRIKVANCDPTEYMDLLENVLEAYGLSDISTPKTLPIQENQIDFPGLGPVEMYLIDVALTYPTTDQQLRALLSERWNIPQGNIVVAPRNHPEVLWREKEGELREYEKGASVLLDDSDTAEDADAGKRYSTAEVISKKESERKDKPKDDIVDSNTKSPVGSK